MKLDEYMARVGYSGPTQPDRATLDGLVRAQIQSVPFENLNQQMGIPVSLELQQIYRKIVVQRRGGWCFELNSMFKWVLESLGFEVSMLAGYVGLNKPAPDQPPDHMLLRVECGGALLVDVGFGGAMRAPIPLRAGTWHQTPYSISLSDESNGFFRYAERAGESEASYWFTLTPVGPATFEPASMYLQTDPGSSFLRTLTAQKRYCDRHVILRGLIKRTVDDSGMRDEKLPSKAALVTCLGRDFDLDVPEIAELWTSLVRRHKEVFGT